MKKILLVAALAFSMVACKKTYTCDCTTTSNVKAPLFNIDSTFVTKSTSAPYSAKMTKTQAQAACDHEATTVSSTEKNDFEANLVAEGVPPGFVQLTATTKCTLQ